MIVYWSYQVKDASGRLWCWSTDDSARYVYLHPERRSAPVARTEDTGAGVHIDRDQDDNVIGIEFI